MKDKRARSPTCQFEIDRSKGYEQICLTFTNTELRKELIGTSKQDFMAMKPYIGEQLTLAL